MEHIVGYEINVMLNEGMYSIFCDIFSVKWFSMKLKFGKFNNYLAFWYKNDTGVRTSVFFQTKIPHQRLIQDTDVAFKLLVFMVQKLRIGALKNMWLQQNFQNN